MLGARESCTREAAADGRDHCPFVQHPGEPGHVALAAEAVLGARSHWGAHRHAEPLRKRPANARYGGEAVRREAAAGRRILVRPLLSASIRYRLGVWDMDVGNDLKHQIKQQTIWCSRDARTPRTGTVPSRPRLVPAPAPGGPHPRPWIARQEVPAPVSARRREDSPRRPPRRRPARPRSPASR